MKIKLPLGTKLLLLFICSAAAVCMLVLQRLLEDFLRSSQFSPTTLFQIFGGFTAVVCLAVLALVWCIRKWQRRALDLRKKDSLLRIRNWQRINAGNPNPAEFQALVRVEIEMYSQALSESARPTPEQRKYLECLNGLLR